MGDTLIANAVKGWRFLYRRGFIEGFGHLSARLPDSIASSWRATRSASLRHQKISSCSTSTGASSKERAMHPASIRSISKSSARVPTSAA